MSIGKILVGAAIVGAILIAIIDPEKALQFLAADVSLGFVGVLIG